MTTKATPNKATASTAFQPMEASLLFQGEGTKTEETSKPSARAMKVAKACVSKLPTNLQKIVEGLITEVITSHHDWQLAEATMLDNVNNPNYFPGTAKWNSGLQPSKKVRGSVGINAVEASLKKVVVECKQAQRNAAIALQQLERDAAREHTITCVWKLMLRITNIVIKTGLHLDGRPDRDLATQILLHTVKSISDEGEMTMMGCSWSLALDVLIKHDIMGKNPTLLSDPSFVEDRSMRYAITTQSDDPIEILKAPYSFRPVTVNPMAPSKGTQTCAVVNLCTDDDEKKDDENELEEKQLVEVKKNLSIQFDYGESETTTITLQVGDALMNRHQEPIQLGKYFSSLRRHLTDFVKNLVFEEDDSEENSAATRDYVHRGCLVKTERSYAKSYKGSRDFQNKEPTNLQKKSNQSKPSQQKPQRESTSANSARQDVDPASGTQKTPSNNTANPFINASALVSTDKAPSATSTTQTTDKPSDKAASNDQGETENTDTVAKKSIEDPLEKVDQDVLKHIVDTIADAFKGLIHMPYLAYVEVTKNKATADDLLDCFLHNTKEDIAETALDLIHKEKRVTPQALGEIIKNEQSPLQSQVNQLERKVSSLTGEQKKSKTLDKDEKTEQALANKKARRKRQREKKKLKKQQEKQAASGEQTEEADASGASNTNPTKKQKKNPKNSNRHPGPTPPVTKKKKGTDKPGNGKGKNGKNGKKGKGGRGGNNENK